MFNDQDKFSKAIPFKEAHPLVRRGWTVVVAFRDTQQWMESPEGDGQKFTLEEAIEYDKRYGIVCEDCKDFCRQKCQVMR